MKILLLSAYDAPSHRYWRRHLCEAFCEHDWTVLSLPARYFSWRIRGNSLSWAYEERQKLEAGYDLLVATSMTDLSSLRGLVPALSKLPTIVYFHENQFAYPVSAKAQSSIEPCILNLYTALCADKLVFNSHYNAQSFFDGAATLLRKLPDHAPLSAIKQLRERSSVLPVPILEPTVDLSELQHTKISTPDQRLQIVWNHRWEYDKGPDLLLAATQSLKEKTNNFCLHIAGQRFRNEPEEFRTLKELLNDNLGQYGYLESRSQYLQLLAKSDVVLSTAAHDFQGLSVLEAVQHGCIPLTPERLAYPELLGSSWCYAQEPSETDNLCKKVLEYCQLKQDNALPTPPTTKHLEWPSLKNAYRLLLEQWPTST